MSCRCLVVVLLWRESTITQVAAHIFELLDARDNVRHIPGFCYSDIVLMIAQLCYIYTYIYIVIYTHIYIYIYADLEGAGAMGLSIY